MIWNGVTGAVETNHQKNPYILIKSSVHKLLRFFDISKRRRKEYQVIQISYQTQCLGWFSVGRFDYNGA